MKRMIKKLGMLCATLLFLSLLVFLAFTVIPGDAALSMLGVDAEEETVAALREELGMNRPVLVRYADWLLSALRGDFGQSFQYRRPVSELIAARLPVTVTLTVNSFLLILLCSLPLGILSAWRENSVPDHVIMAGAQVGMAIPAFFLGILLSYLLGILLTWFPIGGYVSYREDFGAFWRYLLLPAVAIAIPKIAMLVRFLRNSIVAQKKQDYVRTARSKGNSERRVLLNHVLINSVLPTITMLAMMTAEILAGSIVVEQVFNVPGLGRLLVSSIANRDYPVVQAIVVYIALVVVVMNTLADLLYRRLDPRLR